MWLDSRLAIWIETLRTIVVADLHWGYAASHHARGNLLPAWGDDVIERRLRSLIDDYSPEEMIWLGDIVHAAEGGAGAESFLRRSPIKTTVVRGNHDRRWPWPAEVSAQRGDFLFHHGDRVVTRSGSNIEVIGHHHPAVTWRDGAGGCVKLPALIAGASRMILPAFSPWAAGTEYRGPVAENTSIWAIAPKRIFAWSPQVERKIAV